MNSDFSRPSGDGPSPAVMVIGALVLSGLVFFFFTKKHLLTSKPQPEQVVVSPTAPPPVPSGPSKPAVPAPPVPAATAAISPAPAPAKPSIVLGFARPMDLGVQVVRSLAGGDISQVAKMVGGDHPDQKTAVAAVLEKMIKDMGYKAGPEDRVQVLGQMAEFTRLSVPLLKPGNPTPLSLLLDVERDTKMGWKITRFHLPKELDGALAAAPPDATRAAHPSPGASPAGLPAKNTAGATASLFVVDEHPDALTFASQFLHAMLRQDVMEARNSVDETKVPAQKLAGMCILFEEGLYELKPSKPLVVTAASANESWVIAQVQSEKLQQSTEFGLEIQRPAEDKPWKIVGVNLSEMLGSFAKNTAKMGVPYTPIVINPKGGESLALYFEYDKATLHPRAEKQLIIVAGLLKERASRKLHITGRTDALGSDTYNKELSEARAKNVKEKLAALGVPADQVITEGMGKADPTGRTEKKADGTDDPASRSHNRRAEIFLDF